MLAQRVARYEPSGICRSFESTTTLADPIHLSGASARLDAPAWRVENAGRALRAGVHRPTGTQGLPAPSWRVVDEAQRRHERLPEPGCVAAGVMGGIVLALPALRDTRAEALSLGICARDELARGGA